ncbi:hypothetical protein [Aminobacterium colombiense]|uniref:Lin1244/Lin1753-like N-terminal domain-containing protein n=1 Tax=Aminobacterium colombiense (strain DSM 12261 / ALA-1) TaxID=572547 RepID=D5EEU3_AMICL|nr:hypothetical protein [Aminobacterium colombiense]ADE57075.1 hypothetical protein Amico_0950 [Aminobacterium colombiense DSM 12261]
MKWIKHNVTATRNSKELSIFLSETGLEGYGFYWRVLEIIAEQIDADNISDTVTFPLKTWCKLIGNRPQTIRKLAVISGVLGVFEVGFEKEYDIEMLKIGCPHILKIADEYTARVLKQGVSKGGKNRDSIGRVSGESPSRIDKNITEKKNDPFSSENDERLSKTISLKEEKKEQEHRIKQYFDQFWKAYPRKVGKQQARKKFTSLLKNAFKKGTVERDLANLEVHLQKYLSSVQETDLKYVKHPATWLNSEDFTEPPENDGAVKEQKKLVAVEGWG